MQNQVLRHIQGRRKGNLRDNGDHAGSRPQESQALSVSPSVMSKTGSRGRPAERYGMITRQHPGGKRDGNEIGRALDMRIILPMLTVTPTPAVADTVAAVVESTTNGKPPQYPPPRCMLLLRCRWPSRLPYRKPCRRRPHKAWPQGQTCRLQQIPSPRKGVDFNGNQLRNGDRCFRYADGLLPRIGIDHFRRNGGGRTVYFHPPVRRKGFLRP